MICQHLDVQTCPYMYDNFKSLMDFNIFCISITNVTKTNASQYDVSMLEFSNLNFSNFNSFKFRYRKNSISFIKLYLLVSTHSQIYVRQWEFSNWFFFQSWFLQILHFKKNIHNIYFMNFINLIIVIT